MKKIFVTIFICAMSMFPFLTYAASLSVSPSSGTQQIGKNFSVSFFANTNGQSMNASSGVVSFPSNLLEVVSVSKTGSIFSLWVQEPTFSNTSGTVNFEGVVLNPGFVGSSGKLLTVTFRPKAEGTAIVKFNSGAVLANDGFGTNLASTFNSATFTITPSAAQTPSDAPVTSPSVFITSQTHPDQDAWYNLTSATFDWDIPAGALDTRLLVGRNPNSTPSVVYTPPINTKTVDELNEGTYYFSVQHRTSAGWGPVSRFRLNIDTTAPSPFDIALDEKTASPAISFETDDLDSGFSHYELTISDGDPIEIEERVVTSYVLPVEYAGVQTVQVVAYDNAGNATKSSIQVDFGTPAQTKPVITEYPETIEQGKLLIVSGTGTPGNEIEFTLLKQSKVVSTQKAFVDADGTFSFAVNSKLSLGYHNAVVTSIVEDARLNSRPVSIDVEPTPILGFALQFVSYLGVGLLVVLGITSFVKVLLYLVNDLKRTLRFLNHRKEDTPKRSRFRPPV